MKILIADDEDYTREGLIESIPWEEYDIDEIMQAVNGEEAFQIVKWFQPDIVLTDIRMPKMDGIQFASRFLEQSPDSRIIFMSGYMEIEYLRSAIQLSAIDYIEKPVDLDAVKKALKKACEEIREKRQNQAVAQTHREIQQQKLFHLLTSREMDGRTLEKLAGELDFPLNQAYVCMTLIVPGKASDGETEDRLQSLAETFSGSLLFYYNEDKKEYNLLCAFQEKDSYRLLPFCQKVLEKIPDGRLGLGMVTGDYKGIYNSYQTAEAAINCSFYQEEQRLFQIDEGILQKNFIEPGIYGEFLQMLSESTGHLEEWFDSLFTQLTEKRYYHKEQVYTLMVSLVTAVYRHFPELYGERIRGILSEGQIQPVLFGFTGLRQIQEFVMALLEHLEDRKEQQSAHSRIIRGVLEEVARHFGEEDFNVAMIAARLHLSPAYLNVLFKQEMKLTLKQYLSNYRLDMAKKLLEQEYEKITEIAEKCGYANANYFSKVFREATGMSPAEYRKEKCGGS